MSDEQKPFVTGGVIDGKAVAATIREEIAATVRLLKEKHGKVGELSVIAALLPCQLQVLHCPHLVDHAR
jgi:hypothetical protein